MEQMELLAVVAGKMAVVVEDYTLAVAVVQFAEVYKLVVDEPSFAYPSLVDVAVVDIALPCDIAYDFDWNKRFSMDI